VYGQVSRSDGGVGPKYSCKVLALFRFNLLTCPRFPHAVPFFTAGYPAIAPGGIKPYTVNVSVELDNAPATGLVVKCTAYLKSGDLRTYPRKWEIYDPANFLGAYSAMVVGRYVALPCLSRA
jgi:hypothetical protein